MGKVNGNVTCTDRVDIRSEGSLIGDVITHRISVEDGALLTGSVQVRAAEQKDEQKQEKAQSQSQSKPASSVPGTTSTAAAAGL